MWELEVIEAAVEVARYFAVGFCFGVGFWLAKKVVD